MVFRSVGVADEGQGGSSLISLGLGNRSPERQHLLSALQARAGPNQRMYVVFVGFVVQIECARN